MDNSRTAEVFLLSGILHDAIANVIYKVRMMDEGDLDYYIEYFLATMPEAKYSPQMKAKVIELIWTIKDARIS